MSHAIQGFSQFIFLENLLTIFAAQDNTHYEKQSISFTPHVYILFNCHLKNHPEARVERAKLAEFVENYINSNPREDQVYIIPIVFHVVHNYGLENISYEQIAD